MLRKIRDVTLFSLLSCIAGQVPTACLEASRKRKESRLIEIILSVNVLSLFKVGWYVRPDGST